MKRIKLFATFLLVASCAAILVSCDNHNYPTPMVETISGTWAMIELTEIAKENGDITFERRETFNTANSPQRLIFNRDSSVGLQGNELNAEVIGVLLLIEIGNALEVNQEITEFEFVSSAWRSAGNAVTITVLFEAEVLNTETGATTTMRPSELIRLTLKNSETLVKEVTAIITEIDEDTGEETAIEKYLKWVFTRV